MDSKRIYIKPIINKKASKDARRINQRKRYLKQEDFIFIPQLVDASRLETGYIGSWCDVSFSEIILKPRKPQHRGQAYWRMKYAQSSNK